MLYIKILHQESFVNQAHAEEIPTAGWRTTGLYVLVSKIISETLSKVALLNVSVTEIALVIEPAETTVASIHVLMEHAARGHTVM